MCGYINGSCNIITVPRYVQGLLLRSQEIVDIKQVTVLDCLCCVFCCCILNNCLRIRLKY